MSRVRFVRNPGFEQQIQKTPRFEGALAARTVLVAREIEAAAEPFRHTGEYIRSIDTRGNKILLERHVWHIIEYGTFRTEPQGNVRRGISAAGMRFVDARQAA